MSTRETSRPLQTDIMKNFLRETVKQQKCCWAREEETVKGTCSTHVVGASLPFKSKWLHITCFLCTNFYLVLTRVRNSKCLDERDAAEGADMFGTTHRKMLPIDLVFTECLFMGLRFMLVTFVLVYSFEALLWQLLISCWSHREVCCALNSRNRE